MSKKVDLIIYCGMDCSGKTTGLDETFISLYFKGMNLVRTREPGGTPLGEEVRKILKSDIPFSKDTEAYLFATSRCEHNIQIKKWIEEGYVVLCDRHFLSSYAYQGEELAEEVNKHAMSLLEGINYKIIFYDVNHDNYLNRKKSRNEDSDRFEDKLANADYFNSIRNTYLRLANRYNASIIDTNDKTIKEVNEEVLQIITKSFEEE